MLYYLPDFQVMVLEFIEGKTMSKDALNAPGMPTRMAQAIKQLHAGPRFLTDFNMFRLTEYYLKLCDERDIPIPDGYLERMPTVEQIEKAMSVNPLPTVPCNNDLLAENYIDDGKSLRLIDYEYSGNNDPCFELGNTCQEMEFNEDQIRGSMCRVFWQCICQQDRTHEVEHGHVGCGLGALGCNSGENLHDRIRFLGLGN